MIADVEAIARSKQIAKRDTFNALHQVGTYVRWWQSLPRGEWNITPTTSPAFAHGHGVAVYVRGSAAPVYLSNLEPLSAEQIAAIESRPPAAGVREERPTHWPAGRPGFSQLPVGDRV